MLRTGRPIGTGRGRAAGRQLQAVTSTAASVGPYRLIAGTGSVARQRCSSSQGRASPLTSTRRKERQRAAKLSSAKSSARKKGSIEGTKWIVVIPSRSTSRAR